MKLFVLLSRFPYPLEKGDKLRAYHQIRTLSKDHKIYLCCLSDIKVDQAHIKELEKYCEEIRIIRLNKLKILLRLLLGVFSARPFQFHYFYDQAAKKEIEQFIESALPAHIYCQLIRTASYVKKYSVIPKTIDYMDALSAGMKRRSESSAFPMSFLFDLESKRLGKFEAELFKYFDNHCIISEQDRDAIQHPRKDQIKVIPNGISENFFVNSDQEKKYDLLFTGNMNYPPNVMAASFIAEDILPELQKLGWEGKVLIAGANPSAKVRALQSKDIEVSGWIDDIRDAYSASRIFVAPMFIGSGLQNKLLEAMAQGLPCVTTSLANNALGAKNDESILIAEKKEGFAEKIFHLSFNNDEAFEMGRRGQSYIKENFSWVHQTELLGEIIATNQ